MAGYHWLQKQRENANNLPRGTQNFLPSSCACAQPFHPRNVEQPPRKCRKFEKLVDFHWRSRFAKTSNVPNNTILVLLTVHASRRNFTVLFSISRFQRLKLSLNCNKFHCRLDWMPSKVLLVNKEASI